MNKMTTETLTCPYCNAAIGVSAGLSVGQQIVCPRCGDAFRLRVVDSITSQPVGGTGVSPVGGTGVSPVVYVPSRRSNRLIAGIVIAVMLLMAGSGLIFMLMTQQQRRAYDTSRPPRRPGKQRGVPEPALPPIVARVAPDKLAALGYLPAGVNFLLGVRVVELLDSPAGVGMARQPLRLGRAEYRLHDVAAWLGFRLEDLDHLVLAVRIDEALPPPFYVVFRTAKPYDEGALRQRLKGTRRPSAGKKKLYAFRAPRADVTLHAWFADERTVVLALFADQLERLPDRPVAELQQLPEEVRTVLKQRREAAAPIWIVGHSRDWSKTSAAKFFNGVKKEDRTKLAALRTFGIWLATDNPLVVKGVFACKNETEARELEGYFRSLRGPDAQFKTALDGRWITLQYPTRPDFLRRALKH